MPVFNENGATQVPSATAELTFMENGDPKLYNCTPAQLAERVAAVSGNTEKRYFGIGGAVRRDTLIDPDWFVISDSAHIPVNLTGAELATPNLKILYNGNKIGTMVVTPDETLASAGVSCGASVSSTFANVSFGAPCTFIIDFDNANAITFDAKYFAASRFDVVVAANGLITITHPIRQLKQKADIRHTAGSSYQETLFPHYISSNGTAQTKVWLIGEAEGLITYDGIGEWIIDPSATWVTADLTFAYDAPTGVLTVTHPQVIGSPGCNVDAYGAGTEDFVCAKFDVSSNGFKVRFRKLDGTIPGLTSSIGFYFSRGVSAIRTVPTGKLIVDVGHVKLDAAHIDVTGGNVWCVGLMEKAPTDE